MLRRKIKFDDTEKAPKFNKFHTPVKGAQRDSKGTPLSQNMSVRHTNMQSSQSKMTRHHIDVDVDYGNYSRKISKYDIDRQTVDFHALKKEKAKDRTDNVKLKNDIIEREKEAIKAKEL